MNRESYQRQATKIAELEQERDILRTANKWVHDNLTEAREENQRLRDALQKIVSMDTRAMYERCPDCYTDECNKDRVCKDFPLSRIGKVAKQAIGEP